MTKTRSTDPAVPTDPTQRRDDDVPEYNIQNDLTRRYSPSRSCTGTVASRTNARPWPSLSAIAIAGSPDGVDDSSASSPGCGRNRPSDCLGGQDLRGNRLLINFGLFPIVVLRILHLHDGLIYCKRSRMAGVDLP